MRMSVISVYEKKSGARFLKYIFFSLVISVLIFVLINIKLRPFVIAVAKGYAENAVSNTLNLIIDKAMKEDNYTFINMIHDSQGRVAAVTMNGADTNILMTKIAIELKKKIANMEEIEARIPLGNFLPYPFLAGIGPEIPIKFLILANTSVSANENFVAKGINQTLYTLSFHVVTRVGIYIPAMHSSVSIENDVPIAQTLIVGGVPDNYTNVEGMEGTVQDTVFDID